MKVDTDDSALIFGFWYFIHDLRRETMLFSIMLQLLLLKCGVKKKAKTILGMNWTIDKRLTIWTNQMLWMLFAGLSLLHQKTVESTKDYPFSNSKI